MTTKRIKRIYFGIVGLMLWATLVYYGFGRIIFEYFRAFGVHS